MATKTKPLSVRISAETDSLIAAEAQRTNRSKGAVLESLASEALRTRMFPGISFRGDDWERRAWVIGTALDVWQIVQAARETDSIDALVEGSAVSERQVRLALTYAERFPAEIDSAIDANRRPVSELRREYPFIDDLTTDSL